MHRLEHFLSAGTNSGSGCRVLQACACNRRKKAAGSAAAHWPRLRPRPLSSSTPFPALPLPSTGRGLCSDVLACCEAAALDHTRHTRRWIRPLVSGGSGRSHRRMRREPAGGTSMAVLRRLERPLSPLSTPSCLIRHQRPHASLPHVPACAGLVLLGGDGLERRAAHVKDAVLKSAFEHCKSTPEPCHALRLQQP